MAVINSKKLKFTVYGRGYDDSRGNSGNGKKDAIDVPYTIDYAVFDSTGRYCWIRTDDSSTRHLGKFDTMTWAEVDRGDVSGDYYCIVHPCNVENNLGYAWDGTNSILFDLTTNEIYLEAETSIPFASTRFECVLVDGILRIATLGQSRASNQIFLVDTETLEITRKNYTSGCCGFIDDSSIYCYYDPAWFSDHGLRSKKNMSGSDVWSVTSQGSGSSAFSKSAWQGLTGHGNIYLPSNVGGEWVLGEYSASSAPDFETPAPVRTFGHFNQYPGFYTTYLFSAYSHGKAHGCWTTNIGVFLTDFNNLELLDSRALQVIAMNDDSVLCRNNSTRKGILFEF